jgi:hypothetical protein
LFGEEILILPRVSDRLKQKVGRPELCKINSYLTENSESALQRTNTACGNKQGLF